VTQLAVLPTTQDCLEVLKSVTQVFSDLYFTHLLQSFPDGAAVTMREIRANEDYSHVTSAMIKFYRMATIIKYVIENPAVHSRYSLPR
jgi:hypothetical protein